MFVSDRTTDSERMLRMPTFAWPNRDLDDNQLRNVIVTVPRNVQVLDVRNNPRLTDASIPVLVGFLTENPGHNAVLVCGSAINVSQAYQVMSNNDVLVQAVGAREYPYMVSSTGDTLNAFIALESKVTNEVAGVKADLAGVKADLAGVKADLAGVKADLAGFKEYIESFIKKDLPDIIAKAVAGARA